MTTFAEKLRELRDKRAKQLKLEVFSEARLAKDSGVPFSAIREYAMGRSKPTFETVVKLAAALGASCEDFAGCEFPRTPRTKKRKKR